MSPAVLYRNLPGEGLDAFIAEFRRSAARDPFGTVLILPTSRIVREVYRRPAMAEALPVLTESITTLPRFARRVVLDHAGGETLISASDTRLILARLLAPGRYPLLAATGAVEELATLFEVFIMRKVDYPAALGDLASGKTAEIAALFEAYLRFLDDHDLVDESTLIARAADLIAETGGPPAVYVYGLFEPMPLERDLLLALRETAEEFHYSLPSGADPAVFADDGEWLRPGLRIDGGSEHDPRRLSLTALFARHEPLEALGYIYVAERRDRPDEVRAIAQEIRNLLADGVRPDEIAVAFPDFASALPSVEEVFPDFGIPYSAPGGRPLTASPLIRTLLDLVSVPLRGYRRQEIVALATSPYLPDLDGCMLDLISREARIRSGPWDDRLDALRRALDDELAAPDTPEPLRPGLEAKIAAIDAAREIVRELIAEVATLEGRKTLSEHLTAYRSLLERWGAPIMPVEGDPGLLEGEARDREEFWKILTALDRLARLFPDEEIPLAEFSSLLRHLAAGTRVYRRPNLGLVQVVGVREIAHLEIPYLFIGDLVEGVMPRLTTRLPFSTDAETRRLGTRTGEDILREERYQFIAALLSARRRVYLSWPAAEDAAPLVRSVFIDAVLEGFHPEIWGDGEFPDSRLAAARRAGATLARGDVPSRVPPGLSARETIRRLNIENYHRYGGYDSPYDGVLEEDPAILAVLSERFGDGVVISPTALETYADCPFRFYMGRVLGFEPLPEADPDLTAQERGSLIHRIVYRFYSDWTSEGNPPIDETCYPEALRRILEIASDEVDGFLLDTPAWAAEKEHLLGSPSAGRGLLERFLQHEMEIAASGLLPRAFEVSFGLPGAPGPVEIPIGDGTIRLRGRVDRVDVLPGGRFIITDYKTGSYHPRLSDIAAGKALQLPLYLLAVEKLTGMEGVAGTYYVIRRGEVRNRPVFRAAGLEDCFSGSRRNSLDDVREVVETALSWTERHLAGIRAGRFPPRSDTGSCPGYCGFRTVCRFNPLRLLVAGKEVTPDGAD